MATAHSFTGYVVGDLAFHGLLDGEPRLAVARQGHVLVTDIEAPNTIWLDHSVFLDSSKMAFDSSWLDAATILHEGTSVANAADLNGGFALLASFPDPGYVPVTMLWYEGCAFGSPNDGSIGWKPATYDVSGPEYWSNQLHTRVDRTTIRVRLGNPYNGYYIPSYPIHWMVLATSVL